MRVLQKSALAIVLLMPVWQFPVRDEMRQANFNLSENKVAIDGYDPVAYFILGRGIQGREDNAYTYKGITYYFMSTSNKDIFKAHPDKYEPQYGGWSATEIGKEGKKVEPDLQNFKIEDNHLYLFRKSFFSNSLSKWNRGGKRLKKKADEQWRKIMGKE